MKKLILSAAICAVSFTTVAQVGVGTTDPKATLDITGDKGMLLPRIADHTALVPVDGTLSANEAGLQVYNTTTNKVYVWNGTAWATSVDGQNGKFIDGTTATDAVFTGGNVGIGTTTPNDKANLLVQSDGSVSGKNVLRLKKYSNANQYGPSMSFLLDREGAVNNDGDRLGYISFKHINSASEEKTGAYISAELDNNIAGSEAASLDFSVTHAGVNKYKAMHLTSNGNLGVGVINPTEKFEVKGNAVVGDGASNVFLKIDGLGDNDYMFNASSNPASPNLYIRSQLDGNSFGSHYLMSLNRVNGFVGIGIGSPTTKLHVKGMIRVETKAGEDVNSAPTHVAYAGTIIFQNNHFYGNTTGLATGWKQLD